jgi:hypothetical protein
MTTCTSTLENICRNEKLVSEHSERNTEENNEDEGEMETERETTEQEETLLDNDKALALQLPCMFCFFSMTELSFVECHVFFIFITSSL